MAKTEKTILNPYAEGVSYDQFLASVPEGTSVEDAVKSLFPEKEDAHKVEWIVTEIESHKSHQANKAENLKRANAEYAKLFTENEK